MVEDLEKELEKINSNAADVVKKIGEVANALIAKVKEIEKTQKKKLEDEMNAVTEDINKRISNLQEAITSANVFLAGVESKENGDDVYVELWNIQEVVKAQKAIETLETEKLENILFENSTDIGAEVDKLQKLVDALKIKKSVVSLSASSLSFGPVVPNDVFPLKKTPNDAFPPKKVDVSNYFPIDFNRIPNTRSVTSSISTGESSTHDGGAIFDKDRRVVVATSGNYNNGKNLKVTKIGSNPDSISGSTRLIENVIPFNTHGSYPLYDGSKWVYFFESEGSSNNRFGRIDIDNLDAKDFKELSKLPSGSFDEYSSPVFHFGSIYALGSSHKLWRFNVPVNL